MRGELCVDMAVSLKGKKNSQFIRFIFTHGQMPEYEKKNPKNVIACEDSLLHSL